MTGWDTTKIWRKKGKKTYATMYGREKTEGAITEHMKEAKSQIINSQILKLSKQVMIELVEWMGTREN